MAQYPVKIDVFFFSSNIFIKFPENPVKIPFFFTHDFSETSKNLVEMYLFCFLASYKCKSDISSLMKNLFEQNKKVFNLKLIYGFQIFLENLVKIDFSFFFKQKNFRKVENPVKKALFLKKCFFNFWLIFSKKRAIIKTFGLHNFKNGWHYRGTSMHQGSQLKIFWPNIFTGLAPGFCLRPGRGE